MRHGDVTWRGRLLAAAFLAFGFSLAGVGCGDRFAGTEVPDPYEVAGVVRLQNGKPAAGAIVYAFPTPAAKSGTAKRASGDEGPAAKATHQVVADAKGKYQFDSLPKGFYTFSFEDTTQDLKDRQRGHLDSVGPVSNGRLFLDTVTLTPPAQLLATVSDFNDHTPIDSALCEVEGTPYQMYSEQGVVYFYLPEGGYSVKCSKSGYGAASRQLELYAEQGKPLEDKVISLLMDHGEVPVVQPFPATVTAEYDKGTGVVTLTWSKVNFPELYQYGIRKVDAALAGAAVPSYSFDTLWRDAAYFGQSDTASKKTLLYTVYALKKDLSFRTPSQVVRVEATRPTAYGADVGLTILHPQNTYSEGDTLQLEARYRNVFRNNKLLRWRVKDSQDSLRDVALASRSGTDTLAFPCKAAGKFEIGFEVTDVNEVVTSKYKAMEVLSAP
jgi:hypothetical protein